MLFILIPFLAMAVIGLACLNIKIGFMVSDATQLSGFDVGFYMMTVFGLFAAEISVVCWFFSK